MMIVAAVMPLLVGAGAVGIDVAQWALSKRHLQRMADTAALAGAHAIMQSNPARPAVDRAMAHNDQVTLSAAISVENAPTSGEFLNDAKAVRVTVTATPKLPFVSFFLSSPTTLSAEATAKVMSDPRFCMITLEDGFNAGYDLSGSSGVTADCGLMANSKSKVTAYTFGGNSARVSATEAAAVGAVAAANNWATGTKLTPNQFKLPDPFASVPEASTFIPTTGCVGAQVIEGNSWSNRTLTDRCWTGGLSFKTRITLASGTYVIRGGTLEFGAGANVTATGPVTFILTGDNAASIAKLSIGSNATLNLTGPTSGSLTDILFYQDRRARYLSSENTLTGNSGSVFGSAFYFPSSNLHFIGTSGSTPICARMVSLRMSFGGNSAANVSCSGSSDKLFGQFVRLVA
jgi:hypothetical protein